MKFKYFIVCLLFVWLFCFELNAADAKCEDSKRVIAAANAIIRTPTQKNIDKYISIMKKRVLYHGIKQDYEAQADDIRSILYFLRKNKKTS